MSDDPDEDLGLRATLGRLLRRIPYLRRLAERRWIPDADARDAHDLIVRERMARPLGREPVEEPRDGEGSA